MSPNPPKAPTRSRAPWIIGSVVAVVALLFAVVALLSGTGSGGSDGGTNGDAGRMGVVNGPVTITGPALPAVAQTGADPAAGKAFPTLKGSNLLDGSPLEIGADGRPKVVMYVAHWCPHCQAEIPVITKWIAEHGQPKDVDLYAVSTAVVPERGNFPPASWLAREKWPVPTMADTEDGSAFKAAGLSSFPSFVVVDANGKVVTRTSGELSTDQFEQLLAQAKG